MQSLVLSWMCTEDADTQVRAPQNSGGNKLSCYPSSSTCSTGQVELLHCSGSRAQHLQLFMHNSADDDWHVVSQCVHSLCCLLDLQKGATSSGKTQRGWPFAWTQI